MRSSTRLIYLFFIAFIFQGCGGGTSVSVTAGFGDPQTGEDDENQGGLLIVVSSGEQLVDSIQAGFTTQLTRDLGEGTGGIGDEVSLDTGAPGVSEGVADGAAGARLSTTYTQEVSVDEHDTVKYDGKHLYVAPTRGLSCCFVVDVAVDVALDEAESDGLVAPIPEPGPRAIRILATDPVSATVSEAGSIELPDDRTVEGMYIKDDQLATITSTTWWGYYGREFERIDAWAGQSAGFRLYDVSAASAPEVLWEIEIEGGFVNSRLVDDTVYLITRHTPQVEGLQFYPLSEDDEAKNQPLIEALTIDDIIPRTRINGEDGQLFAPDDCYVLDPENELAPGERGHPVLTTIIAIDLQNPGISDTLCYNESVSGTYVSPTAIHLTQHEYPPGGTPNTIVHRFEYGNGLEYSGSGKVAGDLRTGGNLDFRISESAEFIRLVTTAFTDNEDDRFEHRLHVLAPSSTRLELDTVAQLPNEDRPEAIGKPNEDLYGVRFLGDRAFLVTFERIDPLYVIDLSDHRSPRIAGELEVTGFSDFLHPVSDALLLGLGQDERGLVKLELFDISRLDTPLSLSALSIPEGADWSYSDARYDRHAFTYLADVDGIDRFTVPVNAGFSSKEVGYNWEDRLHLFEIHGKTSPSSAFLTEVGYISATSQNSDFYGGGRNRSVLHDDAVFYIFGDQVWSALWTNPSDQLGPQ